MLIFTGCAVKPIKSMQTINGLQVSLTDSDENQYTLVDQERRAISTSNGTHKLLKFSIPQNISIDQCFSVLDKNGKYFLSDKPRFKLSLIQDHRNLVSRRQSVEKEIGENKQQETIYFNKYLETVSALESNNAFINNSCTLQPQKTIPSQPTLECEKYDPCFEEGKKICTEVFIKKKACKFFIGRMATHIISVPACNAMLTDEGYRTDEFFNDVKEGTWTEILRILLGPLPLIYRTIIEVNDFDNIISPCVNRVIQVKKNNQIKQWENTVARIEAEPYEIRNECISLVNDAGHYSQKAGHHRNIAETETKYLEIINREIGNLALKNIEVHKCNN